MKRNIRTVLFLMISLFLTGLFNINSIKADDSHTHDGIAFTAWTSGDSLPSEAGNYYLSQDVYKSTDWTVPEGTVNLCLNGHNINAEFTVLTKDSAIITVNEGSTLNLYDENNNGKIGTDEFLATSIRINEGAEFNLYGGILDSANCSISNASDSVKISGGKVAGRIESEKAIELKGGVYDEEARASLIEQGWFRNSSNDFMPSNEQLYKYRLVTSSYGIYVGGTLICEANKNDVFGDGKVRYDSQWRDLYINNASISEGPVYVYGKPINNYVVGIYVNERFKDDLTIHFSGDNTISDSGNHEKSAGISFNGTRFNPLDPYRYDRLALEGEEENASLKIISNNTTIGAEGIVSGSRLYFTDLKLDIELAGNGSAQTSGISAADTRLRFENSDVTIRNLQGSSAQGIKANKGENKTDVSLEIDNKSKIDVAVKGKAISYDSLANQKDLTARVSSKYKTEYEESDLIEWPEAYEEGTAPTLDNFCYVKIPGNMKYPLWVGGVQVSENNKADVLKDGTVSYDPKEKALTLNNANITGGYSYTESDRTLSANIYTTERLYINGTGNLSNADTGIKLKGEANQSLDIGSNSDITITTKENGKGIDISSGLYMYDGKLSINAEKGNGISAIVVYILDGTVEIHGGVKGISSTSNLHISAGKVIASNDPSSSYSAINAANYGEIDLGRGEKILEPVSGKLSDDRKNIVNSEGSLAHSVVIDEGINISINTNYDNEDFISSYVEKLNDYEGSKISFKAKAEGSSIAVKVRAADNCSAGTALTALNKVLGNDYINADKQKYLGIGPKDSYTSYEELEAELSSEEILSAGAVYNLFWANLIERVDMSVKPLSHGTVITAKDDDWTSQSVKPEVSIATEHVSLAKYGDTNVDHAFWLDESYEIFYGEVVADNRYNSNMVIKPDFGYYFQLYTTKVYVNNLECTETYQDDNTGVHNLGIDNFITSIKDKVKITFYDDNKIVLKTVLADYGSYLSEYADERPTPSKKDTAEYKYSFVGWDPAWNNETMLEDDLKFKAVFDSEKQSYTVTFKDENGTVLLNKKAEYGTAINSLKPADPSKASTVQNEYTFDGWINDGKKLSDTDTVTTDITYTAEYKKSVRNYNVTFYNDDGTVMSVKPYPYGTKKEDLEQPTDPKKPGDTSNIYVFKGWNPALSDVSEDAKYYAEYEYRKYKITWVIGDTETTQEYEYNVIPKHSDPVKDGYVFMGWQPSIEAVTKDQTYTAQFVKKSDIKYTAKFYRSTDQKEIHDSVTGTLAEIDEVRKKIETSDYVDGAYSFVFLNWNYIQTENEITYTATYSVRDRYINIRWLNGDGSVLKTERIIFAHTPPKYVGPTPTKAADKTGYTYHFDSWPSYTAGLTKDTDISPIFKEVANKYKITFVDYDGTVLKQTTEYDYNTAITDAPSPERAADVQYTYTFNGWEPTLAKVTGDQRYVAKYSETLNKYTVTWKNGESESTEKYDYGSKPSYTGSVPTKQSTPEKNFIFKDWYDDAGNRLSDTTTVTGDITFNAIFDEQTRLYPITFKNIDGKILKQINLLYGEMPNYTDSDPEYEDGSQYIYTFTGWDPNIDTITKEQIYTAAYKKELKKFTITFDPNNGEGVVSQEVEYDAKITKPNDPIKQGKSFAGWYLNDSKVDLDTYKVKGAVTLIAQYYEKSYDAIINSTPVRIASDNIQGKTISNRYNDKPLVILSDNGVIVVPANMEKDVTIPLISNKDNYVSYDATKNLSFKIDDHMYGIYLKVEDTDSIENSIINEDKKQKYTEVKDSGFTAEFRRIDDSKDSHYDYPGSVALTFDLKKLGISLPEERKDYVRTYYAAHNYSEALVEYLPVTFSNNNEKVTVMVRNLSPFAMVYKESERSKPVPDKDGRHIQPKTGD